MSELIIQKPIMLCLLPLVLVFIVVFRVRMVKRRQDMQAFGEDAAWRGSEHRSMELWRLAILVVATVMIIVALTRPAANPHPQMLQREGRDVVFLLDVSKSMLAEDRLPNRLQSAKASIAGCVKDLDDHRMGLVVFAGSSSIICPLTVDKEFFLDSLEKAGPDSVAHGGTRVGDAILKVCDKLFSDSDQGYKDIILLTDGGDHSESLDNALELVNEKQVKLIAIGLGDEKKGARIPIVGKQSDYMVYKNQEVWSRLDSGQLSAMVKQAKQGAFLAVGTRQMKLGDIYKRISEQAEKQQLAEESVITYDEIFQLFIASSLILLVVMTMIPHTLKRRVKAPAIAVILLACLMPTVQSADLNTADDAFESGEYKQALEVYEVLAEKAEDPQLLYKKGNTQYRLARYSEALISYTDALSHQPEGGLLRDITYNLGNTYFKESKNAENMYLELSMVNQSVTMYRRILLQNSADRDVAVNMELAKVERRELQEKIKEDEKRRKEMKLALDKLKRLIGVLIQDQSLNLKKTDEYLIVDVLQLDEKNNILKKEQKIEGATSDTIKLLDKTNDQFFKDLPAEVSPLGKTKEHLAKALTYESTAIDYIIEHTHDAYIEEEFALDALRAALEAMPRDPESADQEAEEGEEGDEEGESEEGEGDEEGEEGDQESDSEGNEEGDMKEMDTPQMNLEAMDLPPPNDSPQDIIERDATMQQARQTQGAKKKGKPVEKDW